MNSVEACALGSVCLVPSGNIQGGYKSLSLTMGEILYHFSWTDLPMSGMFIHRVEQLATGDKHPEDLDLTFVLGLEVKYLPLNTENEVNNETRYPTVEVVGEKDMEQQMEDAANDEDPRKIEESDYNDKDNNQICSTDGGVSDTESTRGFPRE